MTGKPYIAPVWTVKVDDKKWHELFPDIDPMNVQQMRELLSNVRLTRSPSTCVGCRAWAVLDDVRVRGIAKTPVWKPRLGVDPWAALTDACEALPMGSIDMR